jgi:hypothetical protein
MAKNNFWESSVKSGQPFSDEHLSEQLKVDSDRRGMEMHRLLGDPRIAVGVPVQNQLAAAANLSVNKNP